MTEPSLPEESIFALARDVPPGERAAYLDRACAGDPALRAGVDALLAADARTGDLLDLPEQPTPDPTVREGPGTVIGPYKLLEPIGEGGFGVVFLAEQTRPVYRKVALKVLKPGMDTRQVVARFEAERQALALMDHPNIARILDGGETTAGRPYFVMELVRGVPVTEFCDRNHLMVRDRIGLFVSVCQAVQHAHTKGVIHRDLKPSNVLVTLHDGVPVPKVIDFGVAKALGQKLTDKTLFTGFAQMVGTPVYMSPEQAELSGLDVDTRSDVYSLGVLLYELLTGTTPFDGERLRRAGYDEMRRILREEEPPKPSTRLSTLGRAASTVSGSRRTDPARLTRLVRGELDWVVMRCLEKDRGRRYETVDALAKDVQRYLADEPVQACRPSAAYRVRKFVRRNRGAVVAASLVALALVGGIVGTAIGMVRANRERDDKVEALRREQRVAYVHRVGLAHRELEANNVGRADRLLDECPEDLRGWEWHYLRRLRYDSPPALVGHTDQVVDVAVSRDGRLVASASHDRTVRVWNAMTGRCAHTLRGHTERVLCVTLSPDGRRLASGSSVRVSLVLPAALGGLAPHPVLVELGEVRIWDIGTGKEILCCRGQAGPVLGVRFSPDGGWVASAGADGVIRLWEANSGRPVRAFRGHPDGVTRVEFSPDGGRLASAGGDGSVRVWDPASGQELSALAGHRNGVRGLAFSPDGRRLASAGWDSTARVWDLATGEEVYRPLVHPCPVFNVAFTPDGERLATAGWDKTVKLWDAKTGEEILTLRGHTKPVFGLAFGGDGRRLASGSEDGAVWLWDATPLGETPPAERFTLGHTDGVFALAYSRDGRLLAAGGLDHSVTLWDPTTGRFVRKVDRDAGMVWGIAFHPDGDRLASGNWDGELSVWDSATGRPVREVSCRGTIWGVAYSPDGRRLATANNAGIVTIRDAADGRPVAVGEVGGEGTCLAFSPDGRRLACGGFDRLVTLFDASTGRPIFKCAGHGDTIRGVAYSPDGRYLASASFDETVRIWDADTGELIHTLVGHKERVWTVAFSPDSRRLASGCLDATVRVWDVAAGREIRTLRGSCGQVRCVAFSPDGKQLAAGSGHYGKGEVRIWDVSALDDLPDREPVAQKK